MGDGNRYGRGRGGGGDNVGFFYSPVVAPEPVLVRSHMNIVSMIAMSSSVQVVWCR